MPHKNLTNVMTFLLFNTFYFSLKKKHLIDVSYTIKYVKTIF